MLDKYKEYVERMLRILGKIERLLNKSVMENKKFSEKIKAELLKFYNGSQQKVKVLREKSQRTLEKSEEEFNNREPFLLDMEKSFNKYSAAAESGSSAAEKKSANEYYDSCLAAKIKTADKYIETVEKWIKRIENTNKADQENLKHIYIENANVIGVTCGQSGSREFTEDYPEFDIVIIDEVSKATPPELLLPMLKAKKVVLVGDHN